MSVDPSELYRPPGQLQQGSRVEPFVHLGGRTTATAVGFVTVTLCSFVMESTLIVEVEGRAGGSAVLAAISALAALGFFVAGIAAAILLGVWLYRAARNVRALGRAGMRFSPALGVVSLYVPVFNFVLPVFALSELRRASEPGPHGDSQGWKTAPSGDRWWITLWWASWVASSLAMWNSLQPHARGTVPVSILVSAGLASGLTSVACYASIRVMKDVEARQARAVARQTASTVASR
jgi:hypothetical protein